MTGESFLTKREIFTEGRKRLVASLAVMAFLSGGLAGCGEKVSGQGAQDPSEQKPTTTVSESVDSEDTTARTSTKNTPNTPPSDIPKLKKIDESNGIKTYYRDTEINYNAAKEAFVIVNNGKALDKEITVNATEYNQNAFVCNYGTKYGFDLNGDPDPLVIRENDPDCLKGDIFNETKEKIGNPPANFIIQVCVNTPEDSGVEYCGSKMKAISFYLRDPAIPGSVQAENPDIPGILPSQRSCEEIAEGN